MIVASFVFNFAGGDAMAYFVMTAALGAIIWSVVRRRPIWRLRDQPARAMFLGAFVLIAVAFALTSRSPADFKYAGNFLMFFFFVAISTFLGRFAARGNLERIAFLALIGASFSLAVALFQATVLKETRVSGIGTDPIWSAEAAVVMGFIAAAGCLAEAPLLPRPLFLLGPAFATVTAFLTGSRGPLLAVPVLALIVLFLIGRRARLIFLACIVLAALLALGLSHLIPTSIARMATLWDGFQASAATDSSVSIRLTFWHIGYAAFLHSPIIGYGWEHFLEAAYAYLPDHGRAFEATIIPGNIHLHSDILDLGVSAGLLGLIAYALVIAAPIVDAVISPRDSQYQGRRMAAILLSAGYFCCGLTYLMFGYEFHTTLYTMVSAILLSCCRDEPPQQKLFLRSNAPARQNLLD
jgi:O-antigen ligase